MCAIHFETRNTAQPPQQLVWFDRLTAAYQNVVNSNLVAVCEQRALLTAFWASGFSGSACGVDMLPLV